MIQRLRMVMAIALLASWSAEATPATAPTTPAAAETLEQTKSLIRVDRASPQAIAALKNVLKSWDVAGSADGGRFLDLVVTARQRRELAAAGVPFTMEIEDLQEVRTLAAASYPSFPQFEAELAALASTYPEITQLTSIGTSWEGRDIWCLEISDQPGQDEGEVGVLFMGLHHAREWPSLAVALDIAERLTSMYGQDPGIKNLVDNRRVWVIPCVNPDGYVWDHDQGNDWRRNRHPYPGGIGVDLNRNYAGSANGAHAGAWGSIGSGSQSHQQGYPTYLGPLPFSETETQAIRDFVDERELTISISYHTHGELVLWPWSYSEDAVTDDAVLMSAIGQGMAQQIGGQSGGTYTPQQGVILYPTTGSSDDWLHGYRYYQLGLNTLAYTVEIAETYHPAAAQLQQILDENWDGALYVLQQASLAAAQLTPVVLPPRLSTPPVDTDGDFEVSWTQANPDAAADLYELQELTGLQKLTEDAESGGTAWIMDSFATSSARVHSGFWSFKSPGGDEQIAAMTTAEPLPVELGEQLTFWTWYDIEEDWDMAFVEVSRDGRHYDLLDKFTGSSGGWVQMAYDLDAYASGSVYLRFRYTSDSGVTEEGFYVDDVAPVPSWSSITVLSSNITETSYGITGRPAGDYYYRVRGSNPPRGFGDYCMLQLTQVQGSLGDLNGDGVVDAADLAQLLGSWGPQEPCPPHGAADLDHSCEVDAADLALLLGNWGP